MLKIKKMVEAVLEDVPETRNSDITLMIEIWKRYFPKYIKNGASGETGVWLKDLYELPREDNIKRMRAFVQNNRGLWLPTDWKVAKQRKINEEKWKEYILELKGGVSR